jgi:cytochrome c oxidase subunit I
LITVAAIIAGAAQLLFIYNFFNSIFRGKKAEQNPWQSNTLEWSSPMKHIHGNWAGEIPTVYRGPYEYSRPDREEDFFPQYVPDEPNAAPLKSTEAAPVPDSKEPVTENSVFFAAIKRVFGLS